MAVKKVRFAYSNTYHRPTTLPPNLTYSASTLTSSLGPVTPPNVPLPLPYDPRYAPQYPHIPYPKAPSSRHQARHLLHRYLKSNGFQWSLLDHHSTGIRGRHHLSEIALHEPASEPPLPIIHIFIQMRVSSSHPNPFWICEVRPSNRRYVNILDVLESLFKFLRGNITQLEFKTLSEEDRMVTTQAYQNRYRRHRDRDAYMSEKSRGMKRIDFLTGHTRFAGLSERRQPHEFDLQVT